MFMSRTTSSIPTSRSDMCSSTNTVLSPIRAIRNVHGAMSTTDDHRLIGFGRPIRAILQCFRSGCHNSSIHTPRIFEWRDRRDRSVYPFPATVEMGATDTSHAACTQQNAVHRCGADGMFETAFGRRKKPPKLTSVGSHLMI